MLEVLAAFLNGLLARLESLYLAYLLAQKRQALAAAESHLQDVEAAIEIKRRLDHTDASARERMREWYAHLNGQYQLPSAGRADAERGPGGE